MSYDELLDHLKERNVTRVEWNVYYYNDEDTSDGGALMFADGTRQDFDYDSDEQLYWEMCDVSCDGRFSDTSGNFMLDVESRTVRRVSGIFYDFEQEMEDEEAGGEKDKDSYMTVTVLPEEEQDRLVL